MVAIYFEVLLNFIYNFLNTYLIEFFVQRVATLLNYYVVIFIEFRIYVFKNLRIFYVKRVATCFKQ